MSDVWITVWFLLMGGGLLFFSIGIWRANKIVRSWPEVAGRVIDKRVERSRGRGFRPFIEYEFKVSKVLYHSTKVYKTFLESISQAEAQLKLDRLTTNLKIRYNPKNPDDCCLTVVSFGALMWFFLILGVVLFGFGLLILSAQLITLL